MKRTINILILALAVVFNACIRDDFDSKPHVVNSPEGAVGGEILVKFRPEISNILDRTRTRSGAGGILTRSGITTVDRVMDIIGGYELERVFPVDPRHEERTRTSGLHLWYTVRFEDGVDVQDVAREFSGLGEIAKIEYNRELKRTFTGKATPLSETSYRRAATRAGTLPFNDPQLYMQWHYINDGDATALSLAAGTMAAGSDVNCKDAWAICKGDPSIIVAVMDEGVMWAHEDLSANIWVNPGEVYKSYTDNDGNGYKGDIYGYNFVDDTGIITSDSPEDTGHGTHVAGIIAGVNNNGKGVSGIAGGDGTAESGVKIMSIQIFAGSRGVTIPKEVQGIKYAADNGAVILQCSWGYMSALANPIYYGSSGLYDDEIYVAQNGIEKEAFEYFIYNAGSPTGVIDGGVVIFASGNEYAAMSAYPGAYKDFVSVSSVAADYTPALYTNFGTGVDISAPGGDGDYHQSANGKVLSTLPPQHGDYGYMDGTSMACPHVSGVAALGLSYAAKLHRHFNSREYRDLLLSSVKNLNTYLTGDKNYDNNWGQTGTVHPDRMDLSFYRGKMGSGLIDAGLLLTNVANGGAAIALPNVFVTTGGSQSIDVMRCFADGETAAFTASSANPAVATVNVESGSKIIIAGLAAGSTAFTVTSSGGETQTAYITVRKNVGGGGLLR